MSWLSPARWLAVAALVAALLAGYGLWAKHQRDIGRAEVRAEWQAATMAAADTARTRERELKSTVEKATQNAANRATQLSADAARARSAADSLREQLDAARGRLPGATQPTAVEYGDTASQLFAECAAELVRTSAAADGHANDAVMLLEAWPR